jgi:predicted transcriptional regulator
MAVQPPAAAQPPARGGPGTEAGPGGGRFGLAQAGTAGKTVVSVATNPAVALELGLSAAQVSSLKAGLDAAKVREALDLRRLADMVVDVLTDSQVAASLNLTAAQQLLIKQKMTPDLIRKTFTPQQVEELSRAAGAAGATGMALAASDVIRQRMMQYDKNGDGQLSDEERRAAFQDFGFRGRNGQDGDQGGRQRGGRQGGVAPAGGGGQGDPAGAGARKPADGNRPQALEGWND